MGWSSFCRMRQWRAALVSAHHPKACMKWTFSRPPTAITEVSSPALCSVSSRDHIQSSAWSNTGHRVVILVGGDEMGGGIMVSSADFKSLHLKPHFSPAPQLLRLSLFKYSYRTAGPPPRIADSREKRPHFHCLSLLSILLSRTFSIAYLVGDIHLPVSLFCLFCDFIPHCI